MKLDDFPQDPVPWSDDFQLEEGALIPEEPLYMLDAEDIKAGQVHQCVGMLASMSH